MEIKLKDDFDLNMIANSGQCFRWEALPVLQEEGKRFRVPVRDKCLIIAQHSADEYELDCSEEEYESKKKKYFDLNNDYSSIRKRIKKKDDPFLYEAASKGAGLRILHQDPWETLISFIISQNRNIPAIKKSIETLCGLAGKEKKDSEGRLYYSFPEPEDILSMNDEEMAACKLGYRDEYIMLTAKKVAEGDFDLNKAISMVADEAIDYLMTLKGVGLKVASCVTLFGLHKLNAFPVDVWIKKVLENEYKKGYPKEKYTPYNGIYQQYMFEYYRAK